MIRPLIVLCFGVGLSVSALASPTSVQEFQEALGKTTNLEHGAEIFRTCATWSKPSS